MTNETEPTLALTDIQSGTVGTVTAQGAGRSLIYRLVGRVNGQGPEAAWRVAVHPAEIDQFLVVINDGAAQLSGRKKDSASSGHQHNLVEFAQPTSRSEGSTLRELNAESWCRASEDVVADKRGALVALHVVAFLGFCAVIFAAAGVFGDSVLWRLVATVLGGAAVAFGLTSVGHIHGQRQVVRWWRKSMDEPLSSTDPATSSQEVTP